MTTMQERSLTQGQVQYCRQYLEEYAALDVKQREPWFDKLIRDVWLLENKGYNWTEEGPPAADAGTNFEWTKNVRDFLHQWRRRKI